MFNVGQIYNRRADIHGHYKGQQYGGIATPAAHPYVFIFTSDAGEEFGYSDGFSADGTFRYTGEGQVGDMQMVKGTWPSLNTKTTLKRFSYLNLSQLVLLDSSESATTSVITLSNAPTRTTNFVMQ
nr:hypothetical protein [Vibrio sp. 624788]